MTSGYFELKNPNRKSAPRVADSIIWINILNEGYFERIAAFENESLFEAIKRYKVDRIPGHCNGGEQLFPPHEIPLDSESSGPMCNSCSVVIDEKWFKKIRPMNYLEDLQLHIMDAPRKPTHRLACCIRVEKWMNEMVITIPEQEDYIPR